MWVHFVMCLCCHYQAQRSGFHCKFTTRLCKLGDLVQDTNPAVRVDGVYAFVVFAER